MYKESEKMKIAPWTADQLTKVVSLWNQEMASEFPMRESLMKQNSLEDVNVAYEGSFVATNEKDQVVGFVITKMWQETIDVQMDKTRGWIQAIVVDKQYQGQGLGTKLYEKAENYLRDQGIKEVQLGGDPFHYFPGVPTTYEQAIHWAEKQGFEARIDCYDLFNELTKEYPFPTDDTIEFSVLTLEDKEAFIAFFSRCFPGRWEYEAIKYFEMGGEGREFVIGKKAGKIVGFCRMNDHQSPMIAQNVYWSPLFTDELGGIGPLGIDENEQKQGYGLAITQAALVFLQRRGLKNIVIDWTILVDFYKKLDFEPWKAYRIYLKQL